jgi:DNA-directed RNA polymerase III subunit RPC3
MSLSETRKVCTDLFKASIIQVQEVPRTNDRKVERTIFLYFVDIERAYGWLLDRWYRTLEHLGRRRVMQDAKAWQIVQRIETRAAEEDPSRRPEVDALLRESEIVTWEQLQKEREMLTTAEGKLQRDAFVLSSLPG